jgi:hypothetical protein
MQRSLLFALITGDFLFHTGIAKNRERQNGDHQQEEQT